jgi:hypothetical protein
LIDGATAIIIWPFRDRLIEAPMDLASSRPRFAIGEQTLSLWESVITRL